MQLEEYDRMRALEDEYWWFVARRNLISTLLTDSAPPRPARILDVGCGTGAMLDELAAFGTVIGADYSPEALSYCRERARSAAAARAYPLARADVRRLPFAASSFDVVTAMDIVEHIDDDKAALREIARVLRPGGLLLATVPAFQALWSEHDVALHHYRRYTAPHFRDVIQRAGLRLERLSYTVSALFAPIWAYRALHKAARALGARGGKRELPPSGAADGLPEAEPQASLVAFSPAVNAGLLALSRWETQLVRRVSLPFGVTVVAVARKAGGGGPSA